MAWRAGNRQARGALRARSAEVAIILPAAKAFCMQWARIAPKKAVTGKTEGNPCSGADERNARRAPSARRMPNSVVRWTTLKMPIRASASTGVEQSRAAHD